jgi:hypothetical protein
MSSNARYHAKEGRAKDKGNNKNRPALVIRMFC